jgi:hypothetical protein
VTGPQRSPWLPRSPWLRGAALALAVATASAWPAPGGAAERLPIFDTHAHYSRDAWAPYPPARILEILSQAGVPRALVSSTPDDGTLRLHEAAPGRVVPILRPYRSRADMGEWFASEEVLDYVIERLDRGLHKGVGEFHLWSAAEAGTPQMRKLAALAVSRGLILHVHAGAAPIRALFEIEPDLRIVWAHAGMGAPPEVVGELLDRYANLRTELSYRAGDIAPGGRLDPAWRDLLLRHSDRFMIGTDTYVIARWDAYRGLVEEHRAWLAQLPPAAARAIAYGNAVREFGAGNYAWP